MKGQCTWFSYNTQSWNCILYRTCPEIEENDQFLSGQKDCQYPILSTYYDFDFFFLNILPKDISNFPKNKISYM